MSRTLAPRDSSEPQRREREGLTVRRRTAQALVHRARIMLPAAAGHANKDVAAPLSVDPNTVGKWPRRFFAERMDGLHDEPRSGAPRTAEDDRVEPVLIPTAVDFDSFRERPLASASARRRPCGGRL